MCDRDLYRVYQITCLACHARLCFLRAFLLRALTVLLAFIFWCALQAPIFYVSYVLWFFTCPHFFMCLAWPHLLTCLQAFIFYLPFFCVPACLFYVQYMHFIYVLPLFLYTSNFLPTFIFVKCFKFFTHITFLHFFTCITLPQFFFSNVK